MHPVLDHENAVAKKLGNHDTGAEGQEVRRNDALFHRASGSRNKRSVVSFVLGA